MDFSTMAQPPTVNYGWQEGLVAVRKIAMQGPRKGGLSASFTLLPLVWDLGRAVSTKSWPPSASHL